MKKSTYKSDKIRQMIKDGKSVKEILKKVKTTNAYIYQLKSYIRRTENKDLYI